MAIECPWSASDFDGANLKAFRLRYPQGKNLVVAHDVKRSFVQKYNGFTVTFVNLPELLAELMSKQ